MLSQLTDITQYAFNMTALAPLFTGVVVAFLGIIISVREGGSRVALPFAFMTAAASVWLLASGVAQTTLNAALASAWFKIAHVGLIFFPPAFLWFTYEIVGPLSSATAAKKAGVAIATTLILAMVATPWFIASLEAGPDGLQFLYGPVGTVFCALFIVAMVTCSGLYAWRLRQPSTSKSMRRRLVLLGFASLLGVLTAAEFLPAHGLDIYPRSFLVMACFFALTTYVTLRYRPTDITPAFVGAQITDTMTDALLVLDGQGIVRLANPAACRLLAKSGDELIGRPVDRAVGSSLIFEQLNALIEGHEVRDLELRYSPDDDTTRTVSVSASTIRDDDRTPKAFLFILRDISARKAAAERIRELAYFDELTKLPNRAEFHRRLDQYLIGARRRVSALSVLFLDLDRFKRINDTLGHAAGDQLLTIVADRLRNCLRGQEDFRDRDNSGSFIARLGGDEFVICLRAVDDHKAIRKIARRILRALAEPFNVGGQEVFCSASIGISRYPQDGADLHTLLKSADTAMYEAKDAGRNNYQFYDASIDTLNRDRLTLESDIRKALENDELELHYQPLIDHRTGQIVGAEALLRWRHPQRGPIAPALFVPIAEDTGVIADIGVWVLQEACAAARRWHDLGHEHLRIAVNVSERQFRRDNLLKVVADALRTSKLRPDCLDLELTEGIIMRDVDQTVSTLAALKSMGLRISVDDFGTGYSSLGYLKRFPIDVLKVDGTFTRGVATSTDDAAITRAIIAMARTLRLEVVAEGVETHEQADFLKAENCPLMQGYLFGRPMPGDAFERFLLASGIDPADTANVVELRV